MQGGLRRAGSLMPLLAVLSCAHAPESVASAPAAADWRAIATPADRNRLRTWHDVWSAALARVTAAGRQREVDAEGALLLPDAALERPAPPAGDYRCRVTRLGSQAAGAPVLVAEPAFDCRVAQEGDLLSIAKLSGTQRPVGLLFPDDGRRLVFLGTMMLGDERMAQQYGRDPDRDMIGMVERIGAARWRLVLPSPRWQSLVDVIELVPAVAG